MKKLTLFFAILFSFSGLSAQWSSVYNDPAKTFVDASFPTSQDGFVVGYYTSGSSFLMITSNAGLTWTEQALPYQFMGKISMVSAQTGYIVKAGVPSRLLKTTNGFSTWMPHTLDSCYAVIDLEAVTDSSGFFLNNGGRLRSFNHNGASYDYEMDTLYNSNSMSFPNALTGYADNGMSLEKTIDGGTNWFCVNGNTGIFSLGLAFCSSDTGYCLADYNNGIWKTTDGGLSFQNTHIFQGMAIAARGQCCIADDNLGHVCWTTDAGANWFNESLGTNNSDAVFVAQGGDFYVFCNSTGTIMKRQPLSVPSISMESSISVYPNPITDKLHISFPENVERKNCSVQVLNACGEMILEKKDDETGEISLEGFASGIYCVRIFVNGVVVESKLISKR